MSFWNSLTVSSMFFSFSGSDFAGGFLSPAAAAFSGSGASGGFPASCPAAPETATIHKIHAAQSARLTPRRRKLDQG